MCSAMFFFAKTIPRAEGSLYEGHLAISDSSPRRFRCTQGLAFVRQLGYSMFEFGSVCMSLIFPSVECMWVFFAVASSGNLSRCTQ